MSDAHSILRTWWKTTKGEPPKASPGTAAVQEVERQYGVTLPDDFRAYLLEAAPSEDFWDLAGVTWWSPSNLKNVSEGYTYPISNSAVAEKSPAYLFFADYLIWISAWAICCENGPDRGKVASIDGGQDAFVATSFTEFVTSYLADPSSVL